MTDETRKLQEEARKFWDKAVGYLKTVPGKVDVTVRKTAESSVLRMEIVGQRRELDQALKELGRRVHDLVKLQGQVTADEIRLAVEKVTVIEARIAEKERRIAELDEAAHAEEGARATARPRAAARKKAREEIEDALTHALGKPLREYEYSVDPVRYQAPEKNFPIE